VSSGDDSLNNESNGYEDSNGDHNRDESRDGESHMDNNSDRESKIDNNSAAAETDAMETTTETTLTCLIASLHNCSTNVSWWRRRHCH